MIERGGDDSEVKFGRGKRTRETFFLFPSCTSRVLFFFQLEPPRRSGELPINKRQPAQRASGRNEDNARRGGAQINLLLDQ